jgi:hypothetical protein
VNEAVAAAGAELDEARRRALLVRAAELFTADRATLPLTVIKYAWAGWRDRVQFVRLRTDEETLAMDVVPAR